MVHAAIPDGRTLWLAVTAPVGAPTVGLSLRSAASGVEVALPHESRPDQPGLRSTRADLTHMLGSEDDHDRATYDVLLDGAPVRSAPLNRSPARPDAATACSLHVTAAGTLQVRRTSAPSSVLLQHVGLDDDGLRLTVDDDSAPTTLALLADDDTVVASCDTVAGGCLVTRADLAGLAPQLTRVVVGRPGAWRPVGRRANTLPEPGRGAPLPELVGDEPTGPTRLRLRWSPQALLQARVLDGDGDDG